jgi:RNase H-fold protein (predicted Holliday junction resolvase)
MTLPVGGLLGLDWGARKVGYATCDSTGTVITPRGTWLRPKGSLPWSLTDADQKQILIWLQNFEPGTLILGNPVHADGRETAGSKGAQSLALELEELTKLPVILVAETLTSWAAGSGDGDDSRAAAIILTDYLRGQQKGAL